MEGRDVGEGLLGVRDELVERQGSDDVREQEVRDLVQVGESLRKVRVGCRVLRVVQEFEVGLEDIYRVLCVLCVVCCMCVFVSGVVGLVRGGRVGEIDSARTSTGMHGLPSRNVERNATSTSRAMVLLSDNGGVADVTRGENRSLGGGKATVEDIVYFVDI